MCSLPLWVAYLQLCCFKNAKHEHIFTRTHTHAPHRVIHEIIDYKALFIRRIRILYAMSNRWTTHNWMRFFDFYTKPTQNCADLLKIQMTECKQIERYRHNWMNSAKEQKPTNHFCYIIHYFSKDQSQWKFLNQNISQKLPNIDQRWFNENLHFLVFIESSNLKR